jgi:peptidoglycan/LPS O-acetylase OafA/YrhL
MAESAPIAGRDETPLERADRNLIELLGELRVALPGVQVLFAFLLIVPFNARFDQTTSFQRNVYFATLICTALASALLVAPSMNHRLEFRHGDKDHLVRVANRLTIAGLTFVALAMTGVVALVTDFVFGRTTTAITTVLVAIALALLWYGLPLRRRQVLRRKRARRGG